MNDEAPVRHRILVVEDEKPTAESLRLILETAGYLVDLAEIGADGLNMGRFNEYDLILLDLMLPDLDGREVLKGLKQSRVSTPVLILSGLTSEEIKLQGFSLGAEAYLTKPFETDALLDRIRQLTEGS